MGFFNFRSLRFKLLAALLVALTITIIWLAQLQTKETQQLLQRQASELLCQIAQRMKDNLTATLTTHARQVQLLSRLPGLSHSDHSPALKRTLFERVRATDPTIAWIGMTDAQGNILVGTDGLLEGKNVAQREWFKKGREGLHFGNVHDAFLLAKLMPKPKWDDLPLHLMDISAPVRDEQGQLIGVVCMHLGWDFAFATRERISKLSNIGDSEILVLDRKGRLLMGTEQLPSHAMTFDQMPAFRQAVQQGHWHGVATWPDDHRPWLTQFIVQNDSNLPDLDWVIAVRQPISSLITKTEQLVDHITAIHIVALVITVVVMFMLVNYFFAPIEQLTQQAQRILNGAQTLKLPVFRRHDEVGILSQTLDRLLTRIREQIEQLQHQQHQLNIYAQLFRHAPLGIMITDPNNRIVDVNPAFEQITGYRPQRRVGQDPGTAQVWSAEQGLLSKLLAHA